MNPVLSWLVFPAIAYLAGSVPFGFIIGRLNGVDMRTAGSGNVGATNVGRVLGRRWGDLCFALDVLKGFIPVFMVAFLYGGFIIQGPPCFGFHGQRLDVDCSLGAGPAGLELQLLWLLVAGCAILGHVFPVWLKFKGGKGVATSLGVVLGFYPYFTWAGLAAFGLWIVTVLIWRYVSLASIVAAVAFPWLFMAACLVFDWPLTKLWPLLAFAAVMACLVIVRHRTNIVRLRAGTENKIGRRAAPP
jgi:acyl phosphate:glycerol-3-phosphate acyltransferase